MSKHMKGENGAGAQPAGEYGRDNVERYAKNRRKRGRRSRVLRGIAIALLAVLVGGGTALALWMNDIQSRISTPDVITDDLQQALVEQKEPSEPYYVLLLGTDGRPGETTYRADTIILARIDPPNKRITLLSIPRDTMVEWTGTTMKINGVHASDGAAGMVEIVSEKCGVPISHYAEVSFDGLATLTDAMGGVTVDVDMHMKDTEHFEGVTELQPGVQTLNGEQALFYCRCRYFPDGDYTRMRHQRTFIKAMLNQLLSTDDPTVWVSLINATADVITTDLSVSEIVSLGSEMVGIDTENDIYTAFVPSEPKTVDGVAYVVADWDKLDEMMEVIDSGGDPSSYNQGDYGSDDSETGADDQTQGENGATADGSGTAAGETESSSESDGSTGSTSGPSAVSAGNSRTQTGSRSSTG